MWLGCSSPKKGALIGLSQFIWIGSSSMWRFSAGLHCPESDLRYPEPMPSMFSFNSAVGACETCRGFGRVIGVDLGLGHSE
jgi:excinuclease UvrABC ATPase subunit